MSTHFVVVVSNLCLCAQSQCGSSLPIYLARARHKLCVANRLISQQTKHFLLIIYLANWRIRRKYSAHNTAPTQTNYNKMTNQLEAAAATAAMCYSKNKTNLFILIPSLALDFSSFMCSACQPVVVFAWDTRDRARAHESHKREKRQNEKSKRMKKEMSYFRQFAVGILSWNEWKMFIQTWRRCCSGNKPMAEFNGIMSGSDSKRVRARHCRRQI